MNPSDPSPAFTYLERLAGRDQPIKFEIRPEAQTRDLLAKEVEATAIGKLSFSGTLTPMDQGGWQLSAQLGATVTQECVVTLQPVKTRIDLKITRRIVTMSPEKAEVIDLDPEADDDLEPLKDEIDLGAIASEELALATPQYPRLKEADLKAFAEAEGVQLDDERENPFAALAELRDKLNPTSE